MPAFSLPFGQKFNHNFLVLNIPEEKYRHHTVLVWHSPKKRFCKVVARFRYMEKEIANAGAVGRNSDVQTVRKGRIGEGRKLVE
jgi:hypothetical protein